MCIGNIFNSFSAVAGDSRFNQLFKVHSRVSSEHKYAILIHINIFATKQCCIFPKSITLFLWLSLSLSHSLSLSLWFAHRALAFLTASLLRYNTLSSSGIWYIQLHTATFSISGKWLKRSPNRGHHVANQHLTISICWIQPSYWRAWNYITTMIIITKSG